MTRIAIYPGSFDPPTRGHEDLIRRSLALADEVIVAVAVNPLKQPLFTVAERLVALFRRTPFARILSVEHRADEQLDGDSTREYGDTALTFCHAP